jgi:hypothetical protein
MEKATYHFSGRPSAFEYLIFVGGQRMTSDIDRGSGTVPSIAAFIPLMIAIRIARGANSGKPLSAGV